CVLEPSSPHLPLPSFPTRRSSDLVDRDLTVAATPRLSDDWRLGITYNAALQLATIALAAEGYRAARERHHERTILSLRDTIGEKDRKSTRLNSSHQIISYAVFCLK